MEWIGIGLIAAPIVLAIVVCNRLVTARNRYRNAFTELEIRLARRHELARELVQAAQRHLPRGHEALEAVDETRNRAAGRLRQAAANPRAPVGLRRLAEAEQNLANALGRLLALSGDGVEFGRDEQVTRLAGEIASRADTIVFAREAFNDAVIDYNLVRQSFPNWLIAGLLGFGRAPRLEIDASARPEMEGTEAGR